MIIKIFLLVCEKTFMAVKIILLASKNTFMAVKILQIKLRKSPRKKHRMFELLFNPAKKTSLQKAN